MYKPEIHKIIGSRGETDARAPVSALLPQCERGGIVFFSTAEYAELESGNF